MGTSRSRPTNQTPNEPNPSLSTSTDQTQNAPVNPPLVGTSDRNRKCCSCHNREPIEVEYTNLGDGRYLCPDCLSISLMEPRQLKPIIRQVHSFFDDHLKLPVRKDIPIFFVDANVIYRGFIHERNDSGMIYGVTIGGRPDKIKIVKRCVRRGTNIIAVTKMKEVNGDKVTAILLLFGLPKQVVGATLAHEMVHAWIHLQGWTFRLETSVEESICDVVASMWLDYTADENDPSYTKYNASFAKRLSRCLRCSLENDQSYTENNASFAKKLSRYRKDLLETGSVGAAEFPKAKRAVETYGLEGTLMRVAHTRSIPE